MVSYRYVRIFIIEHDSNLKISEYWPTWMSFRFYRLHLPHTRALIEPPVTLIRIVVRAGGALLFLAQDLSATKQEGGRVSEEIFGYDDAKHNCSVLHDGAPHVLIDAHRLHTTLDPDVKRKRYRKRFSRSLKKCTS